MIRVLLAGNKGTTCRGLDMLLALEPDIQIVGSAGDGCCVIQMAEETSPQVIAIDLDTKAQDGLEAIRTLRARGCHAAIVAVSKQDSSADRQRAIDAGAQAFLSKLQNPEALIAIIRQMAGVKVRPSHER